jgi:carbamoyltransferase
MNLKIKFRESFRPFAPSVLAKDTADYFELAGNSPYMRLVAPVRHSRWRQPTTAESAIAELEQVNVARSDIPAVTHVDHSARIQTVHAETSRRLFNFHFAFYILKL